MSQIPYNPDADTVYEKLGGDETFRRLVDEFYDRIEADEELRSIFPEDLEPGKEAQFLFLTQYWGGPARYSAERGHPRLRMRHSPYDINQKARDRWVEHMVAAMDEIGIPEPVYSEMVAYFERGATFMINTL